MKIALSVELLDTGEKFNLEARSPDFRAWEKATGTSWLKEDTSITGITDVAYYAAKRTGKFTKSLEIWGRVADVDEVAADPEDPTQPEAGENSSPAS